MMGVGSFLINPGAMGTVSGDLVLSYDLYSVDPGAANFDPIADLISNGDFIEAAASVTEGSSNGGGGSGTVPEPGTFSLLVGGLAAIVVSGLRRRRKLSLSL
jgi:PEP-CTERM motif-containing protein